MTFLALILSLLLQQFWKGGAYVYRSDRFDRWAAWVDKMLSHRWLVGLTAVLGPTVLLVWLMGCLESVMFGLPWIFVAAAVLACTMGRGDYRALCARYRGYCEQGDYEAAYLFLQQELGPDGVGDAANRADLQSSAHAALLYEGFQRWFSPLLYFMLLGPAGALIYRLTQLAWRGSGGQVEGRLLTLLDWLPSRLLALSFAITGDFVRCRAAHQQDLFGTASARELLHVVAEAAAVTTPRSASVPVSDCCNENLKEVSGLLSRSAVLWVASVALLALVG